jgi:hypothetical protein
VPCRHSRPRDCVMPCCKPSPSCCHIGDTHQAAVSRLWLFLLLLLQLRWRSKLEAFLGRPLLLPQLGPDAPVLDLNKLFLEVRYMTCYVTRHTIFNFNTGKKMQPGVYWCLLACAAWQCRSLRNTLPCVLCLRMPAQTCTLESACHFFSTS